MIDLLATLYDYDAFRFALWSWLDLAGLDGIAAKAIDFSGHVLFEDFSIGGK